MLKRSLTCIVAITLFVMSPVVFAETRESIMVVVGDRDANGNFASDPVAFAQTEEDKMKTSPSEFVMRPRVIPKTREGIMVVVGDRDANGNFASDPVAFAQTEEDRVKAATIDHPQSASTAPVDACGSC